MNRKTFHFEKLDVWQQARELIREIYQITSDFPKSDIFGLTAQIRRAAVSVANNLAEGTSRTSLKEQGHFTGLAHGSLSEVACDLILAVDLNFLPEAEASPLLAKAYNLSIRLHNLRESQFTRANTSKNH